MSSPNSGFPFQEWSQSFNCTQLQLYMGNQNGIVALTEREDVKYYWKFGFISCFKLSLFDVIYQTRDHISKH